jgi:hypothetical protein
MPNLNKIEEFIRRKGIVQMRYFEFLVSFVDSFQIQIRYSIVVVYVDGVRDHVSELGH